MDSHQQDAAELEEESEELAVPNVHISFDQY
jgi:hypothetical protein